MAAAPPEAIADGQQAHSIPSSIAILFSWLVKAKRFLFTFTTDYDSSFLYVWTWVISSAFTYNAIFIPLRASFVDFNNDYMGLWIFLDYIYADLIYAVDMFVKCRTRIYQHGLTVTDVPTLQRNYFRSMTFFYDLISILPTDFALIAVSYDYVSVRLNRLLRLGRFFDAITRVESITTYPNAFRFATTIFAVLAGIFYVAIFYNSYSKAVGYGDSDLLFQLSQLQANQSFFTRFTRCIYWATMTFCFIGEQPEPNYAAERIIQTIIWILGLTTFGVIVGRFSTTLDNINLAVNAYYSDLESIRFYFRYRKVPKDVAEKVTQWYNYAYENHVLGISEKALKPLPDKLREEIALDLHISTVRNIHLFADLEASILAELVDRFKLQIFSPNDFICKKGDLGREMYVIRSGILEVVSDDGKQVLVTLTSGSVFGEISLLSIPGCKAGNRRTANVRSKGYSDLFTLSKEDFHRVMSHFPESLQKLVDKGTEMLWSDNSIDEEEFKRKQQEEAALRIRSDALEAAIDQTEQMISMLITSIARSQQAASRRLDSLERMLFPPTPTDDDIKSVSVSVQPEPTPQPPASVLKMEDETDKNKPITAKKKEKKTVRFALVPDATTRSPRRDQEVPIVTVAPATPVDSSPEFS